MLDVEIFEQLVIVIFPLSSCSYLYHSIPQYKKSKYQSSLRGKVSGLAKVLELLLSAAPNSEGKLRIMDSVSS